jgi:hypothetical protein
MLVRDLVFVEEVWSLDFRPHSVSSHPHLVQDLPVERDTKVAVMDIYVSRVHERSRRRAFLMCVPSRVAFSPRLTLVPQRTRAAHPPRRCSWCCGQALQVRAAVPRKATLVCALCSSGLFRAADGWPGPRGASQGAHLAVAGASLSRRARMVFAHFCPYSVMASCRHQFP